MVKPGYLAAVKKGTYTVAEMGQWSLSGLTRETLDSTAFGDTYKQFEVGIGDYGTISFQGNYDPTDTNGQVALNSACIAATHVTDLYFYIDSVSYWRVSNTNSDYILLTKCNSVSADKSGIATVSFEGKVSGSMKLV